MILLLNILLLKFYWFFYAFALRCWAIGRLILPVAEMPQKLKLSYADNEGDISSALVD